jgi:hypothetical protein
MNRSSTAFRLKLFLLVTAALLAAAVPQARVICACSSADVQERRAPAPGCCGSCTTEGTFGTVRPAVAASGCDCEGCRHAGVSSGDVVGLIPAAYEFEQREEIVSAIDGAVFDSRPPAETVLFGGFGSEDGFTQRILLLLSTSIMLC